MILITVFIWTLLGIQGAFGEIILAQSGSKSVQLSQTVTIDCKSSSEVYRYPEGSVSKDYYISWYLQKAGEAPKLLIYFTTMRPSGVSSKFTGGGSYSAGGNGLDFSLTITGVQAEDAGDYYCLSTHKISGSWVFTQ
ncbi:hypothetical protein SRHO_G00009000 [Serrasalmus rhombeus]